MRPLCFTSAAGRVYCANNLKQVGLALADHENTQRALALGNMGCNNDVLMGHTAFTHLLPYAERRAIYRPLHCQ